MHDFKRVFFWVLFLFAWTATFPLTLTGAAGTARAQDAPPVVIELERFGVGSVFRPGDFVATRLRLTSNLPEPTGAFVVWESPEATGDIVEYSRPIALNPGVPVRVWHYLRTMPGVDASTNWAVRIYRDEDGERGPEITGAIVSPAQVPSTVQLPPEVGVIGIVGTQQRMGLDQYLTQLQPGAPPIAGHEPLYLSAGLTAEDLPDRWEGLDTFHSLVWADELPQNLSEAQGRALREWIYRGGHLVIALPAAGNPWGLGEPIAASPLHDLLPSNAPEVDPAEPLASMLPILSKSRSLRPDAADLELSIRTFPGPDDLTNQYEPLIALPEPDGRTVVIQRNYGFGLITLVGLPISTGQMIAVEARGGTLPEADVFWNRIFGWRRDTPDVNDLRALDQERRLRVTGLSQEDLGKGRVIAENISMSGAAGAGLGLAFFLFVVYWLVAGPVGFALLRTAKLQRHSWLVFALTGLVFTLVALVSVRWLRESDVRVQHLTFLDHVARPGPTPLSEPIYQRATSYLSVYLPGYRPTELSLESEAGWRDVLAPFAAPGVPSTRFQNPDRYVVPFDEPAEYVVPVRATTKELYARWTGPLDPEWGGLFRAVEPLRLEGRAIRGSLTHDLPGTLQDFKVFLILPDRMLPPRYMPTEPGKPRVIAPPRGNMLNVGRLYAGARWPAGGVLDLAAAETELNTPRIPATLVGGIDARYMDVLRREHDFNAGVTTGGGITGDETRRTFEILSLFHQMPPPEYIQDRQLGQDPAVVLARVVGRDLDLSNWFNRPALIITGYLENSELPIPLRVEGNEPQSTGLTMVRWVHPLPVDMEALSRHPDPEVGSGS